MVLKSSTWRGVVTECLHCVDVGGCVPDWGVWCLLLIVCDPEPSAAVCVSRLRSGVLSSNAVPASVDPQEMEHMADRRARITAVIKVWRRALRYLVMGAWGCVSRHP